jgi:hypothetical protein
MRLACLIMGGTFGLLHIAYAAAVYLRTSTPVIEAETPESC